MKSLIEQLAERVIKEGESQPNGSVTTEQFSEMLKKHLPDKSASEIAELTNAAEKEQPNEEKISLAKLFSVVKRFCSFSISHRSLFQDDEDNYGEFIRIFKRQLHEDKQQYIHECSRTY